MINRTLKLKGETVTVTRFINDGEDDHGDVIWEEETEETPAIIEVNRQPFRRSTAAGEELSVTAFVYVDNEIEVHGASNDKRPSWIVRNKTGNKYRVLMAFDEGNGIIKCETNRLP